MNPQLQEALDALEKADAAGNVEDAKALADYIRQLQAQEESSSADMTYPVSGAAIGAATGAVTGPAVGAAVDTAATKVAEKVAGPKGTPRGDKVAKWLATQTTGPNVGGATFEEAYKKSEIARGKPVQSRGSQVPIRKGFLGIENQPAEPSLPQKTAANIISSERLGKPSIPRRVGGMGVMGAEAGKTISDVQEGNYGDAAISALGTIGGALSQSRIKPLRAIGTGLSLLVPTVQGGKEVKEIFYPPKQEEEKAAGGLVHLAEGGGKFGKAKNVAKKLSDVLIPREGQTLLGTMADRTKATEGFSGGPGFINLHPEYTWAMDSPGAANRLLNAVNQAGGSNRAVVSPMLMSTTAHRSNRPVFEKMYSELLEDIRSGKVTPQQIEALNAKMAGKKELSGAPDITSKEFLEFANAFKRRGAVADVMGQKRIGALDLQRHLDETIDPALREAELGAVGPQLFTAESQILKPGVHPGYKNLIIGEKGEDRFTPVPREFLFRDLEAKAMKELGRPLSDYNYRQSVGIPTQLIDEKLIRSLQELGYAEGGTVQNFDGGGKAGVLPKVAKHSISQYKKIAEALEEYLKGNITKQQQMAVTRQYLPIRQWSELPPEYTDEQIINALSSNQLNKALAPVPVGKETGNRLDINAYTKNNPPVFVDTVHDINDKNKVISYNRTGHLRDVDFKSLPNSAVLMGLGTKEQALTPMGAQMGKSKAPIAMIRGTNVGTSDSEVRRMMAEMLNDPNYTQIGMDPRVGSQFYDKATDRPIWTSGEKFQIGPLVMVPKKDIEVTDWLDPRLELKDFPGKRFKEGGSTTPAWQRKEGKSPSGGLNALGRASYKRETGGELKAPQPEGGSRKKSFCARMGGMKKKLTSSKTANDPDSRINKALRKWKC